MRSKEYVEAFTARKHYGPQTHEKPEDFFTNPELERTLVDVRGWGRHFSVLMRRHLNGRQLDQSLEFETLKAYTAWNVNNLDHITHEVLEAEKEDERNVKYLSELTFHVANFGLEQQWARLINPELHQTARSITDTQHWIANKAISLIMLQRTIIKNSRDDYMNAPYLALGSQLSELDTHIALLEVAKDVNPDLVVVAAPPDFEGTYAVRNADILELDLEEDQVHGYQVKTVLTGSRKNTQKVLSYDPDFVTVIDGAHELGNVSYVKKLGRSDKVAEVKPGLLSMDHLSRTSIRELSDKHFPQSTVHKLQGRAIARELSRNRSNFIPQAVKNIQGKILRGLYKEPSRSRTQPERRQA